MDIIKRIQSHELWLESEGKKGDQLRLTDENLSFVDFDDFNLNNSVFKNCVMERTIFSSTSLEHCTFSGNSIAYAFFLNKSLKSVVFDSNTFEGVTFEVPKYRDVVFTKNSLLKSSFENGALKDCSFESNTNHSNKYTDITYSNVVFTDDCYKMCSMNGVHFDTCQIDSTIIKDSNYNNCTLENTCSRVESDNCIYTKTSPKNLFERDVELCNHLAISDSIDKLSTLKDDLFSYKFNNIVEHGEFSQLYRQVFSKYIQVRKIKLFSKYFEESELGMLNDIEKELQALINYIEIKNVQDLVVPLDLEEDEEEAPYTKFSKVKLILSKVFKGRYIK